MLVGSLSRQAEFPETTFHTFSHLLWTSLSGPHGQNGASPIKTGSFAAQSPQPWKQIPIGQKRSSRLTGPRESSSQHARSNLQIDGRLVKQASAVLGSQNHATAGAEHNRRSSQNPGQEGALPRPKNGFPVITKLTGNRSPALHQLGIQINPAPTQGARQGPADRGLAGARHADKDHRTGQRRLNSRR
jgi:hypothetical protein